MIYKVILFLIVAIGTFIIDNQIKDIFTAGYEWHSKCILLSLHYNKGVAFGMFSFLGENLKWIQICLIISMVIYTFAIGLIEKYALALGLVIGGAIGNLYDRFMQEGVVDYIYWHCWFDYPVFNYADIMIVLGISWVLISTFFKKRSSHVDISGK